MQQQLVAIDFVVVDDDAEVSRMLGLLPRREKINGWLPHLPRHHHVQRLVLGYYQWKKVTLFEPSEAHLDEYGNVDVSSLHDARDFVVREVEFVVDCRAEMVEIKDEFGEMLTMEENSLVM